MPEHTIAENLARLTAARTDIADAIIAKGGTVTAGDGFEEFPADIATIPSGGVEFSATPTVFTLLTNISNLNAIIPNGVTSIGNAFRDCTGLKSVDIPSSVTSFEGGSFRGCTGLTSINIPTSVTSIGNYAFMGCTGFTSIDIPSSVETIGNNAFNGCTNLTTITVHKAEGSITGAPWGAPNATVVWDG